MVSSVRSRTVAELSPAQAAAVQDLLDSAAAADGFPALNEAGLLNLRHPSEGVRHILASSRATAPSPTEPMNPEPMDPEPMNTEPPDAGGPLSGYAQLGAGSTFSTGQLVVAPQERRHHVGLHLLHRLLEEAPTRLQVWALGNSPAAQALADRAGLRPARELLVMTRPLTGRLREPRWPAGTTVRTFVPGRDEAAWLAVNGRAFADHPEQGAVDATGLAERMAEPWFDPAGFFLAEIEGALAGFHWTKQHSAGLGEVYVLGVDPGAGGRGLGGALLDVGLRSLAERGMTEVELYVEGDHPRAVDLYRGRGFGVASRDVMYAQP